MLHRKLVGAFLRSHNAQQIRITSLLYPRGQHTAESYDNEAAEFRELVRDFASREIAPHAAEIDRSNAFPKNADLWTQMGHMGLHGERGSLSDFVD